jgi:hypothetical protein
MADVTGRSYESFVEFLLSRLGYRDESTAGTGRQYLYEKHPEALCHRSQGVCKYSSECDVFSKEKGLPYGPWYDPDFFVVDDDRPFGCLHITHWSNPRSSKYKFWRTIEDHLQYKTQFGRKLLSINLIFAALDPGQSPRRVDDLEQAVRLHGWDPAIGTMAAVSFDSSILFPLDYGPLTDFAAVVPTTLPGNARKRRLACLAVWDELYRTRKSLRNSVDRSTELLEKALSATPNSRYTSSALERLQEVCWIGRQRAGGLHPTETRYRKGLQHAFIVRELIARAFGRRIDPDDALWSILNSNPRFPWKRFRAILTASATISDIEIEALRAHLAAIPIQIHKRIPIYLLNGNAGLEHSEWNSDFKRFIIGLKYLPADALANFRTTVSELFSNYRQAYGIDWVLADLAEPKRIEHKVEYVRANYISIKSNTAFIKALASDMLTPGTTPQHQTVVKDTSNWPIDIMLSFYGLGSIQEINNRVFSLFRGKYAEDLRLYAYQKNYLVGYLLAGVDIAPHIDRRAQFNRDEFYQHIWPLIAECLWEATNKRKPLAGSTVEMMYRYKKAMRIISSPDLEPISFLLRRSFPSLQNGPTLRGAFNQLSTRRAWGRAALTTKATGRDADTGAVIQTQAVFGRKHISDKTRELGGRMRSLYLHCDLKDKFVAETNPGIHFAVLDGDWPVESKINLLEAGFAGLFEIAELDALTDALSAMAPDTGDSE